MLQSNLERALARPVRGAEELAVPLRRATGPELDLCFHDAATARQNHCVHVLPPPRSTTITRFVPLAAPLPTTTMAPARRPPWGRERGAPEQLDRAGNLQLKSENHTGSMFLTQRLAQPSVRMTFSLNCQMVCLGSMLQCHLTAEMSRSWRRSALMQDSFSNSQILKAKCIRWDLRPGFIQVEECSPGFIQPKPGSRIPVRLSSLEDPRPQKDRRCANSASAGWSGHIVGAARPCAVAPNLPVVRHRTDLFQGHLPALAVSSSWLPGSSLHFKTCTC